MGLRTVWNTEGERCRSSYLNKLLDEGLQLGELCRANIEIGTAGLQMCCGNKRSTAPGNIKLKYKNKYISYVHVLKLFNSLNPQVHDHDTRTQLTLTTSTPLLARLSSDADDLNEANPTAVIGCFERITNPLPRTPDPARHTMCENAWLHASRS